MTYNPDPQITTIPAEVIAFGKSPNTA